MNLSTAGQRIRAGFVALTAGALAAVAVAAPGQPADAQELPPCDGAWCPLATFDDYTNGSLRTQGPWHVNLPGATDGAHASDDVPAVFSGKALVNALSKANAVQYRGNTYADLGELSVANGATSTLFFEFLAADTTATALNVGLSDNPAPGLGFDDSGNPLDLGDYEVQLTFDGRGFVVRDAGANRVIDNVTFDSDQIYAVWMVVDNAADTYQVHIATGSDEPVVAASGGEDTFSFRNGTSGSLLTFLHLNDPDNPPTKNTYVDNIYVNTGGASVDNPSPSFEEHLTFDNYNNGALAGQDGWATSAASVVVTGDPAASGNRVMRISGPALRAHRPIPPIANGSRGTIFFRFYRSGLLDASVGLSPVDTPSVFGHFEVQANNQNSDILNARNRGVFTPAGRWSQGFWQCVWMVADNATDTYQMYSRGGPYQVTTRLPVDETRQFAFRNGTSGALDRFFTLNGNISPSDLYIDDIAIDADSANLRVPGGDANDCAVDPDAQQPVANPIPEEPIASGIGLTLDEFVTIPPSNGARPLARINYLSEVPDGSGRLAVPDLNGPLHLVDDGVPVRYLGVAARFPNFVRSPGHGSGFGFVAFHPEFATNGRFYTVHTEAGNALTTHVPDLPAPANTSIHGVITEWTATNPSASTFSGTQREVLRLGFDTTLHGIQQIGFNPTASPGDEDYGLLYLGAGDGEQEPNWTGAPLNTGKPQGKILRIDPLGNDSSNGQYGIPATNPFVDDPAALGEVFALGVRNPHRFSWDPVDGRMFLGHIGQQRVESIFEVQAGDNFGWNEREGGYLFKKSDPANVYPLPADDEQYGYTYPVAAFDNPRDGNAVVGGFVYRGTALPQLAGKYVFTDVVQGRVFYTEAADMRRGGQRAPIYELDLFNAAGGHTTMLELSGGGSRVDTRLGIDADGELYVLSKQNGKIWRVTGARTLASCDLGDTVVSDVTSRDDWAPVRPEKWQFPGQEIVLAEPGTARPGPRRPFEYAVLTSGPEWGSVELNADVRIDVPTPVGRDVLVVFGYQSDTEFYYAHLSEDDANYAHNGIFVVNNADRVRIDHQWNGSTGAPPAVTDQNYHRVRIRHCVDTGEIAVYLDGSATPLMTAIDTTFRGGRVGFGSFDDIGRIRNLTLSGENRLLSELRTAHDTTRALEGDVSAAERAGSLGKTQADALVDLVDELEAETQAGLDAYDVGDDDARREHTQQAVELVGAVVDSVDAQVSRGDIDETVAATLREPAAKITDALTTASRIPSP